MTLPLFLTRRMKYPVGVFLFLVAWICYAIPNHYPVFQPVELPMTLVDRSIPLVPWTVLIYVSEYLFFAAVYITCQDMENLNKYLYSFISTQTFSCLIFLFWPTTFPRGDYPIPGDIHPLLKGVWTWLHHIDAPTNCFPSLHVSTVFLSAFIFLDEQREKFPLFLTWGALIAFSTLPTKQHYIADVLAGWLLSVSAYWLFHRWMKYAPAQVVLSSYQAKR